ncbi:MAG TPA: hypothetical protein VH539_00865 [Gemmatimonadaceae bacterium]
MEREQSVGLRRSWITTGIAIVAALLGVQHLIQAMSGLHGGGDPPVLVLEHLDVTIFSFIACYAIAKGRSWAPWALAIAGAAAAILVVSLGPVLAMDATARSGLWAGGGSIAVITAAGVWYLARHVTRSA